MSAQPSWTFVANLGDASPLEYGGYFVYHDATGVYGYEAEKVEEPCGDDDEDVECSVCHGEEIADGEAECVACRGCGEVPNPGLRWTVYRVCLDRLKLVDGLLVPESYEASYPHPIASYVEWFADGLAGVADTMGTTADELTEALCSDDGKDRAWAYRCVYDYHGWANGDEYPLSLTRAEVEARYTDGEL